MDKKGEPMAEWSDLLFDVLEHLTSFLSLPDNHRFSTVCRNWELAVKPRRRSPVEQLPWLLVGGDSDPHKYRVFDISENRHYNIDFPELRGHCTTFQSCVDIMCKYYDLPPVPPISSGVIRFVREATYEHNEMTYEDAQAGVVYKAILDYDHAQRSNFTVLILYGDKTRCVAFWRPGNLVWTLIEDDNYNSLDDIAYFEGHFYGIDLDVIYAEPCEISVTCIVDVGPDPKVTRVAATVPQNVCIRTYLVDFKGDLLLVQRYRPISANGDLLTRAFLVYTLDLKEGKYYERCHLDGYSIFLGHNSLLAVHHSQFPRCKENCIYFTSHVDCNAKKYGRNDNGTYDMVKGTISPYYPRKIFHPEIVGPTWWTPNPW